MIRFVSSITHGDFTDPCYHLAINPSQLSAGHSALLGVFFFFQFLLSLADELHRGQAFLAKPNSLAEPLI